MGNNDTLDALLAHFGITKDLPDIDVPWENPPEVEGFTGTVPDFIQWLSGRLICGQASVDEEVTQDEFGRDIRQVQIATGGASHDEDLCQRVRDSVFATAYWASSHRRGLDVYEVPVDAFTHPHDHEMEWLEPATDVFETLYRVGTVIFERDGEPALYVSSPHGVELAYRDEGYGDQRGILTIRTLPATNR
jgi:hypothetical protein